MQAVNGELVPFLLELLESPLTECDKPSATKALIAESLKCMAKDLANGEKVGRVCLYVPVHKRSVLQMQHIRPLASMQHIRPLASMQHIRPLASMQFMRPLIPSCVYPPPPQITELLNQSPVWSAYKDQKHDLFLTETTISGYLTGPTGVAGYLTAGTSTGSGGGLSSQPPPLKEPPEDETQVRIGLFSVFNSFISIFFPPTGERGLETFFSRLFYTVYCSCAMYWAVLVMYVCKLGV